MKGEEGVAQGTEAGTHKFTGVIEIRWRWTLLFYLWPP